MSRTYTISSRRDYRPPMQEMPLTSFAGHPYLQSNTAAIAIYNRKGSQRKITIRDIDYEVFDLSSHNLTFGGQTFIYLQRISSYINGEEKQIVAFDSNNSSLPSQVKAVEDALPTVSGSVIRVALQQPNYLSSSSNIFTQKFGDTKNGYNHGNVLYHNKMGGEIQGTFIREGEGVSIFPGGFATYVTKRYHVHMTFKVGTGTYMVHETVTTDIGRALMTIYNGPDSGVVLELLQLDLYEEGESSPFLSNITTERIDSLDPDTGDESVLCSHDSNNESLAGLIDVKRNVSVSIAGHKMGAIVSRPYLNRDMVLPYGKDNGNASFVYLSAFKEGRVFGKHDDASNIILSEGEGIGIFRRNTSMYGNLQINISFSVETIASGGSSAYSRSRIVNV